MRQDQQPTLALPQREELSRTELAVRFPPLAEARRAAKGKRLRLSGFLPRRWRRRVVINGQQFWLPSWRSSP